MVVIENLKVDGKPKPLYMDTELYYQLTHYVKPSVQKKDFDYVIIVDGEEGSGKSVLGMQIAKVLDPNFDIKNISYTPEDFVKSIKLAKKHECILFDETYNGLSSRSSLSQTNQLLVSNMMSMRQKNLYCILILPSVFMLDRYCVLHRAKGLFHVYLNEEGRRGTWVFYHKQRMKRLWLMGRKLYDYSAVNYILHGNFRDQYMVNEKDYRKKKLFALEYEALATKNEVSKFKIQRDTLFFLLHKGLGLKQVEIVELCKEIGIEIKQGHLSEIITQINKKIDIFSAKNSIIRGGGGKL